MKRIHTRRDAERARQMPSAAELRHMDEERENEARRQCVMADPEIGMLMRNGKLVYYRHRDGRYIEAADPRSL